MGKVITHVALCPRLGRSHGKLLLLLLELDVHLRLLHIRAHLRTEDTRVTALFTAERQRKVHVCYEGVGGQTLFSSAKSRPFTK